MPDDSGLHDRDWYAWTQDQAARLRAWPEQLRPNGLDVKEIGGFRAELGRLFEDSPSLFAQREVLFLKAWQEARRELGRALALEAPEAARRFAAAIGPDAPPGHELDGQILNEDWLPAPPAP
ncbi:MAG: hypothetical protein AAGC69_11880 [Paracraurococcus sp.]